MLSESLLTPALSKEIELSLGPSRAHERKKLALGSCALAWAVKEVPDSEAGPPAAELPRHTDIDPFAQGEARKARAQSQVPVSLRWGPIASQSIGNPSSRVDGRLIRHKESGEEAPTMRVDAIMARQALGVAWLSSMEKDSDRQR